MIRVIKDNRFFFTVAGIWVIAGLCLLLFIPHGHEVLWLNQNRTPAADVFFRFWTRLGEPVAYIVCIFLLLFVRYRSAVLIPAIGISVTLISFLAKAWFHQDRPFPFFSKAGLWEQFNPVEGVRLLGGANSFPSGHSTSAFALFTFLALNLAGKRGPGIVLALTAIFVAVSRIYLLQHFLRDVVFGSVLGMLIGLSFYLIQVSLSRRPGHWLDGKLRIPARKETA